MLVFQKDVDHIFADPEKGIKRAKISPKLLVEIVAEINLYLPEDWRMTVGKDSNFRIEIFHQNLRTALIGNSFRTDKNRILHIIDTIYPKKFIEQDYSAGKKSDTPNLYFFGPPPEEAQTPLFARQYERVSPEGKKEYHRIHPLSKAGLDTFHHRWIEWRYSGDLSFPSSIPSNYHGKNYWSVHALDSKIKKNLRASAESYEATYEQLLRKYNVSVKKPLKSKTAYYETEYKFLIPGTTIDAEAAFEVIDDLTEKDFGLKIEAKYSDPKLQIDTYFDDDNFTLYSNDISLRVRKKKRDNTILSIKKRLPSEKRYSGSGLYTRIEKEAVISDWQKASLEHGSPIESFPYRLIAYLAPNHKTLAPKLTVENKRKLITLKDSHNRRIELCLDSFKYRVNGEKSIEKSYHEIEIESKGAPFNEITKLADYLETSMGLVPSLQSKYERGVSLIKTIQAARQEKRKVIIDTDCGVDDALALILALKSKEIEVVAVTTVAGNVPVEKVNQNIYRVFSQLDLNKLPIVAVGEDRPLKNTPDHAESVHGADGLGDVEGIATSYAPCFDQRPAWEVICDLADAHPNEITLITLGPMTNLAKAIENDPTKVHQLKEVVAMGGVFFDVGNVGPDAEFNVRSDPEAAQIVVRFCRDSSLKKAVDEHGHEVVLPQNPSEKDFEKVAGYIRRDSNVGFKPHSPEDPAMVHLSFVGLDVTHQVVLRRLTMERLVNAHPNNKLIKFVRDVSNKYMRFYYDNEGLDGCYLHDPLAVAAVINPGFLTIRPHIIHVETQGNFTNGMIFPDDRPTTNWAWRNPAEEVIGVAETVEKEAVEEFVISRLIA